MHKETIEMFKTLTELPGAPGNEHAVRNYMRGELGKYSDELIQDNLVVFLALEKGLKMVRVSWLRVIWMKLDLW